MKQAFRFSALTPPIFGQLPALGTITILVILAALTGTGGLSGCKAVDLTAPTDTSTQATADSAQISVTNDISIDPDSLILLLYPKNAFDVTNGSLAKVLGGIGVGRTLDIKVPAGTWKLAYRNLAGNITPMTDLNDGSAEWLQAVFVKNDRYALILTSDGNDDVWIPTFETIPKMQ